MRRLPGVALFLAGPVIWITHFWLVYLVAEAGCTTGGLDVGPRGVTLVTLGSTVVAVAATVYFGVTAARGTSDGGNGDWRLMHRGGALLAGLFALAIALVGFYPLVFAPC